MKSLSKFISIIMALLLLIPSAGCSSSNSDAKGSYIIDAKEVSSILSEENVVLVDMQKSEDYSQGHIKGAVNISRSDIVVDTPVSNSLAPKEIIEEVMGNNGISNNTKVLVYDTTKNMDAARLWWTLKVYGHDNVKVISGGLSALRDAGFDLTTEAPSISTAEFTAADKNTDLIATKDEVLNQVNDPQKEVVLLDTRSAEEFNAGTIPGSILIDYSNNNFNDGTYKPIQHIKIQYMDEKITPDKTVIMYCKTSIRAAQTYLTLYNAGYRNLKIYDGAWVEWSSDNSLPVQTPSGNKVESSQKDNS